MATCGSSSPSPGASRLIWERRGGHPGRRWRDHTADPMQVVGKIVRAIAETGATAVKIDEIGIGWAVRGRLEELGDQGTHRAHIVGVNVGEASSDPTRFPRLRDEPWWATGRELICNKAIDLSDVEDGVIAQLVAPRYSIDSSGRVKVESKADTRLRLGRSPDDADAFLLAFYEPPNRELGVLVDWQAQAAEAEAQRDRRQLPPEERCTVRLRTPENSIDRCCLRAGHAGRHELPE